MKEDRKESVRKSGIYEKETGNPDGERKNQMQENVCAPETEAVLQRIRYDEKGLVPAVVQDEETKQVLMLAYMNEESLRRTLCTGTTWFYSRSRQALWNKGETSGHFQYVSKVSYDCDCDTILVIARQKGAACHTGNFTCFYRDFPQMK